MKIVVVPVGGSPFAKTIDGNLEEMQKIVGGFIEVVPYDKGLLLICDEEGKLKNKPGNRFVNDDVIAGDFFVIADGEEDFIGLSDEQIQKVSKRFEKSESYTTDDVENSLTFGLISW